MSRALLTDVVFTQDEDGEIEDDKDGANTDGEVAVRNNMYKTYIHSCMESHIQFTQ